MPYKLRNNRRHQFKKAEFKIENWREYNQALKDRGSIILWLSPEVIKAWYPKKHKKKLPGGQLKYFNTAIQTALSILVYQGLKAEKNFRRNRGLFYDLNLIF
jgi:hypothetical protein